MKIKVNRYLSSGELIEYIQRNQIKNKGFKSEFGNRIFVDMNQKIDVTTFILPGDTFRVCIEEDIDGDSPLHPLTVIYYYGGDTSKARILTHSCNTINEVLKSVEGEDHTDIVCMLFEKEIVWTKKDGVLKT